MISNGQNQHVPIVFSVLKQDATILQKVERKEMVSTFLDNFLLKYNKLTDCYSL